MLLSRSRNRVLACSLATLLSPGIASADEGMWPVNALPTAALKQKYGLEPTPELLTHLQRSAVNFGGASGSFVSSEGLVMTNHHVASGALADLSTPERDLFATGFLAKTRDEELRAPGMQLRVLMSITDVTDRVNSGVTPAIDTAAAGKLRREAIAKIEQEAGQTSGLTPRVVTLYNGGQYHLYLSKTFTDVRLVFAPEENIASFGGDTDNFEFPRFSLDAAFFRVYENGEPYKPTHFLKVADNAKSGELALVVGHPGRTQRQLTLADLQFQRDVALPFSLRRLWRSETKLAVFAGRGKEQARFIEDDRDGVSNSRKALTGQYAGLLDPGLINAKRNQEAELRAAVMANPSWAEAWGDAWDRIENAKSVHREIYQALTVLQPRAGTLLRRALAVVRHAEEISKPNDQRLRDYSDASLPSLYTSLYAQTPLHLEYEQYQIEQYLLWVAETLGADHTITTQLLANEAPAALAAKAAQSSTLLAPAGVREAIEGGSAWIAANNDPLLALARRIDAAWRPINKRYEDEVESVERSAYGQIAAARFAHAGSGTYPDATGSLRLSLGPIVGWDDPEKGSVLPFTDFRGLFERATLRAGEIGFTLPASWLKARAALNPATPMNFVCTADIIGGNSGSPALNTKGELIGLIFDGNIHSLPGAFHYDVRMNRAVAVDVRGLLEAMDKVYGAKELVAEVGR